MASRTQTTSRGAALDSLSRAWSLNNSGIVEGRRTEVDRQRSANGLCLCPYSASTWCTVAIAIEPSPTAEATRFVLPLRTSPTASTPGMLVSSR